MMLFGTGHRLDDEEIYGFDEMVVMADRALQIEMTQFPIAGAICGMANGFDLAFGLAAVELNMTLWTVRPWAGHRPNKTDKPLYDELVEYATRNYVTNDSETYPGPDCYRIRNEFMVDHAGRGMSFWNGKRKGGTYNCIKYAVDTRKPVNNIYPGKPGLLNDIFYL